MASGNEDDDKKANKNSNLGLKSFNKSLQEAVGGLAGFSAAALTGVPTLKDVGDLGKAVMPLGGAFASVLSGMEGQITLYQTLTKSGITFDGQIDKMIMKSTAAGLSLEQMAKVGKENSEVFAALGAGVNDGLEGFLDRSAKFLDDPALGAPLRNLGMSFEDINENLVLFESISAGTAKRDARDQQQRAQAAFNFSKEMNNIAKLTGKQADQIAADMAKASREGDFKAFLAGLDPAQAEATMAEFAKYEAAGMGDLYKDIMIRGFPSEDMAMLASQMGGTVDGITQMRKNIMSTDGSFDAKNFAALSDNTLATGVKEITSENVRYLATLGDTNTATSKMKDAFAGIPLSVLKLGREMNTAGGNAGAFSERLKAIRKETDELAKPADPEDTKAILQAGMRAQEALVKGAVTAQREVMSPFLKEMSGGAAKFNEEIAKFDMEKFMQGVIDPVKAIGKDIGQGKGIDKVEGLLKDIQAQNPALGSDLASAIEGMKDAQGTERQQFIDAIKTALQQAVSSNIISKTQMEGAVEGLRDSGTIGMTGQLREPKNIVVGLEAGETVFTDTQLMNFARGVQGSGMQDAISSVMSEFKAIQPVALDLQKMIDKSGFDVKIKEAVTQIAPVMENAASTASAGLQGMISNLQMPKPTMEAPAIDMEALTQASAGNMTGMMDKFDKLIEATSGGLTGLLDQSIKGNSIAGKTQRISRGLQGNILKGIGI